MPTGVAISSLFLFLAGRHLNWNQIIRAMRDANLFPGVLFSVFCYITGQIIRGIRCRLLVSRDALLSSLTASNIVVIGYAFNNVFPARIGEWVRCGMLAERTGIPFTQSLSVTFLERVLDGLAILFLFLVATFWLPITGWIVTTVQIAGVVFGTATLVMIVIVISPGYLIMVTSQLSGRFSKKIHDALIRLVSHLIQGVAYLRSPVSAFFIAILSLLIWFFEAGMFYFIFSVFDLPVSFDAAVLTMAVTNLGILVPSSPGFVGPFHFFVMQTLLSLGVEQNVAISYAIIVHLTFYIPITLWGLIATLWYGIELTSATTIAQSAKDLPLLPHETNINLYLLSSSRVAARIDPPSPFIFHFPSMVYGTGHFNIGGKMGEKVLVTGGSGYFGTLLVKRLQAQGDAVSVFDQMDVEDRLPDVAFFQGDIRDFDRIDHACKGIKVIYHCVAQVPLAKDRALFQSVNVMGAENLLKAALEQRVHKVIIMSSSAVFGIPSKNPVDDSVEARPLEDYGRAKLQAEMLARRYHTEHGLDITIIRPRTILGHGRLGIFQLLFDWIAEGKNVYVLGNGDNRYQFVHADDLADASIRAAKRPGFSIYNIGAERFCSMRESLEGLIDHAKTKSNVRSLPLKPAAMMMEGFAKLHLAPFAPYHWLMYGRELYFDLTRAKSELSWQPKWGNIEMFIQSYDWYLAHREKIRQIKNSSTHRSPVQEGVLKLLRWLS